MHSNVNITLVCSNGMYNIISENGYGKFTLKNYITNVDIEFNSTEDLRFIQENYTL